MSTSIFICFNLQFNQSDSESEKKELTRLSKQQRERGGDSPQMRKSRNKRCVEIVVICVRDLSKSNQSLLTIYTKYLNRSRLLY